MKELFGRIDFDGVTYSRALQRFVEKRLQRWSRASGVIGPDAPESEFAVVFTRQGPGHMVHCQLTVRSGEKMWSGVRYSTSPHAALSGALERLASQVNGEGPRAFALSTCAGKRRWVRIPLLQEA